MDLRIFDRIATQLQAKATALQQQAAEIPAYALHERLDGRDDRRRELQLNAKALLYTAEAFLLAVKAELAAIEAETHFKERAGR